jgi:hypothetical protein
MGEISFHLRNRQEVARFESLLKEYQRKQWKDPISHISLLDIYDALQGNPNGGRVFTAFLDLQISLVLLDRDLSFIATVLNREMEEERSPGDSVLSNAEFFCEKMDLHKANTAFILRYRATWDKVMGVTILLYAPDEYDRFYKARSRKRSFRKIAEKTGQIPLDLCDEIEQVISDFDSKYRTAEAHGMGAMRKWSFVVQHEQDSPQSDMLWAWNSLNRVIFLHLAPLVNKEAGACR